MVYSPLQKASKYFKYYIHAANSKGHGTHSPFVYEFIKKVMNDFSNDEAYQKVETLRKRLLENKSVLSIEDFGAGSSVAKSNERTIASIAKYAAKPKKWGQLLFRIARYYQPSNIIELGTSLGISTAYMALGNPSATVTTFEGAKAIAAIAKENFKQLGIGNIHLIEGNFDETLPNYLLATTKIDLAFIDGNHRKAPTLRYFELLLKNVSNDTLLIFDDIHWSKDMEDAWQIISTHPRVTASIDLFQIGIVAFRKEFKEGQSFSIRF